MSTEEMRRGGVSSYRPPRDTMEMMAGELLQQYPPLGVGRFGCYCIAGTHRYSDLARSVECSVFEEFFGNDPLVMTNAYAEYEAHSRFLLVVDRVERCPAGALRVIEYSELGLKTLNDIAAPPLEIAAEQVADYHAIPRLEQCWDVGTLAVLKRYRGRSTDHLIGTMLYGMCHSATRQLGIDHLVTILDNHAYRQLTEMLAVPFVPIAGSEPFPYLGSENSRAAYLDVPSVVPSVESYMSRLRPELRLLLEPSLTRVIYARDIPAVIDVV